jgi:hypothetical protein
MSYCRWSSNHGECDVYVYAHVEGSWTTHVAGRKLKHKVPDELKAAYPKDIRDPKWAEQYMAAETAVRQWYDSLPCEEIACQTLQEDGTSKPDVWRTPKDSEYRDLSEIGPEAGETFKSSCPGECANLLEQLRAKGFEVPQYAIDALREEQAEMDAESSKDN